MAIDCSTRQSPASELELHLQTWRCKVPAEMPMRDQKLIDEAKHAALHEAAARGWSDFESGRFDDVDEDGIDDFISELGHRAGRTEPEQ